MKTCPLCKGEDVSRIMYCGIPAWFCNKVECSFLFGLGSNIIVFLPFNGLFVHYSPWDYFPTLWKWLTNQIEMEE
jgi:hypothetical protein